MAEGDGTGKGIVWGHNVVDCKRDIDDEHESDGEDQYHEAESGERKEDGQHRDEVEVTQDRHNEGMHECEADKCEYDNR